MTDTFIDLYRGERLRLAAPRDYDLATLERWNEDAVFSRSLDTAHARPLTPAELSPPPGPDSVGFRLRTLDDDLLIGFVALHTIEWNNRCGLLAIGIGEPDYRGKGYGSEALRLILRYAFLELNLDRVGLDVIANNQAAIRAYERAGFRHEGAMRQAVQRDGLKHDRLIMGILREEWLAAHTIG